MRGGLMAGLVGAALMGGDAGQLAPPLLSDSVSVSLPLPLSPLRSHAQKRNYNKKATACGPERELSR